MVILPGHPRLDINMAVVVLKLSFIKSSLLSGRVWLGGTSRSSDGPGTSNNMHVWVLDFALLICASVNNLIEMPELFFIVPMENWWSNLGVGLFRAVDSTPDRTRTHAHFSR